MKNVARLRKVVNGGRARICVVGQGYVGLSVAAAPPVAGMRVDGIHRDPARPAALSCGRNAVPGVTAAVVSLARDTG